VETNLTLFIKVLDRNNRGIEDANVIAWSPDRKKAYSGVTDSKGDLIINIFNPKLPPGKAEGYISIKVMRTGYIDFINDYFIKVSQR
jgi:protocatechuate 3,4-dioxygenase beta subunit